MRVLAFAGSLLFLCACGGRIDSRQDLYGSYELRRNGELARLEIRPDSTYTETVDRKKGNPETTWDRWTWDGHCISLNNFLIPTGSVPESLLQNANTEHDTARKTPQGVYQFDWCLPTETTFLGSPILIVNPDRDIKFVKTRH